jgi:hypothetical protein
MTVAEVELLRLYVDDRKDGTEQFNDDQLQDIIDGADGSLHGAAAEVWGMKAATVSEFYLANVDGSFLSRNQIFDHCMAMVEFHRMGGGAASTVMSSVLISTGTADTDASSEF